MAPHKKEDIKMRGKYKNSDWLEQKYWVEDKGMPEIARHIGCTTPTIHYWMKKRGIPRRSNSDAIHLKNKNSVELSERAVHYLEGLILGDGHLYEHRRSASYVHGDSSKKYLLFLFDTLEKFGLKGMGKIAKQRPKRTIVYHYRTKYYPELLNLRRKWYDNGRKIIPPDFKINPTSLFNWYIGDGTLSARGTVVIESYTFSGEDLRRIIAQLGNVGIKATLEPSTGIYIRKESRKAFFQYILSGGDRIPPSYEYKFAYPAIGKAKKG